MLLPLLLDTNMTLRHWDGANMGEGWALGEHMWVGYLAQGYMGSTHVL